MGAFDNEELLKAQFEINWKELNKTVKQILQRDKITVKNDVDCQFLVKEFEKNSFPAPVCGQAIKFNSGFETQAFYKVLLDNADKRLWFFGRKNKKLFSTETRSFFSDLKRTALILNVYLLIQTVILSTKHNEGRILKGNF